MTNLVLTPGGYKPADQVIGVPSGHRLRMTGTIAELVHPNGTSLRSLGDIQQRPGQEPLMPRNLSTLRPPDLALTKAARFVAPTQGGQALMPLEKQAETSARPPSPFASIDGWVVYTSWTNNSGHPISRFASTWTVPPEPASKGNQTIFLFNGIQNSTMIYQPVLQWGPSAAGGGQRWSVASWYADGQTGKSFFSSLVDVSVGQTLVGVMTQTGHSNGKFDYNCVFDGLPATALPILQVEELTWAIETLEIYGVTDCSQYPATSKTSLSHIKMETGTASPGLTWTVTNNHTDCGAHAKVVSQSASDGSVDLWYRGEYGEGGWVARHGLTAAEYQALFDDLVGNQGMTLVDVSGYEDGHQARYAAIWRKVANHPDWIARHGLTSAQHQQLFTDLPKQGFSPVLVNGYTVANTDLFASIWQKRPDITGWQARHGLSASDFQKAFTEFTAEGLTPEWVSGYGSGGDARYAAIWHKLANGGSFTARHGLNSSEYQQFFNQVAGQGFHPRLVSGYGSTGGDHYAAIYDKPAKAPAWEAHHGLDGAAYQKLFTDLPPKGLHPVQVCGYNTGGNVRFTTIWER